MELEYVNYTENDNANVINLGWGGSWRSLFVQTQVLGSIIRAEIAISNLRNNNKVLLDEVGRLEKQVNTLSKSYHDEVLSKIEIKNKLGNTELNLDSIVRTHNTLKEKNISLEHKHTELLKESIDEKKQIKNLYEDLEELEVANEAHNRTIENYEKTVVKLEKEVEDVREDANKKIDCLEQQVAHLAGDSEVWENRYANLVAKLQLLLRTPS